MEERIRARYAICLADAKTNNSLFYKGEISQDYWRAESNRIIGAMQALGELLEMDWQAVYNDFKKATEGKYTSFYARA